jgi:transcriptional antiterminator RfaH
MAYWSCARLHPHKEALALRFLVARGFGVYQPLIQERRMIRGRKMLTTSALFPLYVFIAIEAQWYAAKSCPGVATILTDGDRPARVPDHVIDALRARESHGFLQLPESPQDPWWRKGDQVYIKSGPLAGLKGLYSGMSGCERIRVLMQLFGSSRHINFTLADVEAP